MKQISLVKGLMALCAAALVAPAAFADDGSLHASMRGPTLDTLANFGDRDVVPNDEFASVVGVFNAGGGSLLYDGTPGPFAFGGTSSMGTNGLSSGTGSITTSVTDIGGGQQQIVIEWLEDGGGPMLPAGGLLGGAPVTTISFELDTANSGPDGIDIVGDSFEFKHPLATDAAGNPIPDTYAGGFDLLGAGGAVLFSGTFFLTSDGDISGSTFVSAGGGDLGGFGITGARATFVITKIPAPGAFALLGLAGVIGSRRRRS